MAIKKAGERRRTGREKERKVRGKTAVEWRVRQLDDFSKRREVMD